MGTMAGKTIVITGGSRGIGRSIALRCATEGANIVIAAKTAEPHPKLAGTIHTVAAEIEEAGGQAMPFQLDVRDEQAIEELFAKTQSQFQSVDVLINNASAINLSNTSETAMKRFDLMFGVNVRATFACSKYAIPYLAKAANPHILNLSPPLSMASKWFKKHVAYTMSKYGMSMCTLGMAAELESEGIAVNSLWPRTTIATAAIEFNFPKEIMQASRKPEIMADAAYTIINKPSKECSGNFFIDETVLKSAGVTDLDQYAINPNCPLFDDLFVES